MKQYLKDDLQKIDYFINILSNKLKDKNIYLDYKNEIDEIEKILLYWQYHNKNI
tara:strand:+ start:197 stop:358 length:162 start_codon:yes stop_codon:yes gene_type:complete